MPKLAKRLTDTVARLAKAPAQGYAIYWCAQAPGFGVRVMHNGMRSWVFERRDPSGKTKRETLGRVSGSGRHAISAEAARALALQASNNIAQGRDVAAERRAAAKIEERTGLTFDKALQAYVDDNSNRAQPLKPRTRADYLGMVRPAAVNKHGRALCEGELASIAKKRLDTITGPAVKTLYKALQKRGPTRAAYAMRVLRGTLNYHGIKLPEDPFDRATPGRDRIKLPSANKRNRVIPAERLPTWWIAAGGAPNGDMFQLLLLTGLRRGELSEVKVADVDVTGGRLIVHDPKNRNTHVVLLSNQARVIVVRRVKGKKPSQLLFEQGGDPRKSLKQIVKASGVPFSAHDCRRTFGTIAAGVLPGYVVKRLLNHADGADVTAGHYVHLDETTLRGGWQTVADFISPPAPKRGKTAKQAAA